MSNQEFWQSIIIMFVLLICSAFFSATETAFTSLNRIRMKNLADDGDQRAKRVLTLENNYDNLLYTILIGNNLVNIANTAVATVFFVKLFGELGPTVATIATTVIVLIFGEITPKSLAKEHSEGFAMYSAGFINFLRYLFAPLNWMFSYWRKFLDFIFKTSVNHGITEDELMIIVEEAETQGSLAKEHSQLIQKAIAFEELEAWDILTPRVDIAAIEINSTIEEIRNIFLSTGFSRLPVYEDNLDDIIGILTQKDFSNYIMKENKNVADFVKPVIYVVGSMKISKLLKKFQKEKIRMAIIVDEYGGTTGLVTLEDIIEELVGEIYNDGDIAVDRELTPLQNGSYKVLGSANFEKVLDYFDEEEEINATTVNGWVVLKLDKLPVKGDTFETLIGDKIFKVKVTKADARKATEINLRVIDNLQKDEEK